MTRTEGDLLGRWVLVDTYLEAPDGTRTPTYGDNPFGTIIYGTDGTVTAMVARSDISLPGDPLPDPEAAEAWAGFFAYHGSWTLSGSRVRHEVRIAHDPRLVGSSLERDIAWEGDHLKFTGPHPYAGPGHQVVIVWRRP